MIRVNLLPVREARKKENIRRQVSVFLLCVLFTISVMIYLTMSLSHRIADLSEKIQIAQNDLAKYQAEEREVKKIMAELQKLNDMMNVIAQLEASRTGPVRVMDALTQLVAPESMWLTSLSEAQGQLKLEGVAIDNKTIADFMTRLEGSPLFGGVNLIASKQVIQADKKFQEFSITCQLASQQPEKEPKAS